MKDFRTNIHVKCDRKIMTVACAVSLQLSITLTTELIAKDNDTRIIVDDVIVIHCYPRRHSCRRG